MLNGNQLKRALGLLIVSVTLAAAVTDTLYLSKKDLRFPESQPGKTYTLSKIVVVERPDGLAKQGNSSEATLGVKPSGVAPPTSGRMARDVMGRVLRGGAYEERLANIRATQNLPVQLSRERDGSIPLSRIERSRVPRGSRLRIASPTSEIRSGADLARMEREERLAERRRYGALHPDFGRKLESRKLNDSVDIVIQLAMTNPGFVRGDAPEAERKENARKWATRKSVASKRTFLVAQNLIEKKTRVLVSEDDNDGSFVVRTTKAKAILLSRLPAVAEINEWVEPSRLSLYGGPVPYQHLLDAAYNPANEMVFYGNPDLATAESGLRTSFVNCIDPMFRPTTYQNPYSTYSDWDRSHSEATYYLMAQASPGAYHHHFRSSNIPRIADSIVYNSIRSFSLSWEAYKPETDYRARAFDMLAYIYPYPIISMPAGNDGVPAVPVHRSYNSINVGNATYYNNQYYMIGKVWYNPSTGMQYGTSGYSQFNNPPPKYFSGGAGDRELPDIVVPGYTPDPYEYLEDPCIRNGAYPWQTAGGTSLSAPIANGLAANVISALAGPLLPLRPVEAKASLLVTARNVMGPEWEPWWYDSEDGAGTISGAKAAEFANTATRVEPDNDPVVSGLVSGYFDESSFEPRYFNFVPPQNPPANHHLRIVLTWTSSPGIMYSQNEISDLALVAAADNSWYVSDTYDGNTEMVNIPASDLTYGNDYFIAVEPMIFRKSIEGPDYFYYALAWTWVKDNANY